ncbi:hypothetical protein BKA70DRAFT_1470925 [Coprinopsis sp. MPI-PUGE-AT-0042]|nr:hypothetical protein BKA70DRAFT_1470925 [Coprinopsis sp. MPI-PUGE-AT-0042]
MSSLIRTLVKALRRELLDILLPKKSRGTGSSSTANRTPTGNLAPAPTSNIYPVLNAFHSVHQGASGRKITEKLDKAWAQDSQLTLRIIWYLRSIPDGKNCKDAFYRAFGWLLKNHPRTAIENLPLLVEPVCCKPNKKVNVPHGYWKDLLNIVAMASTDELSPDVDASTFLHPPRQPRTHSRSKGDKVRGGTAEDRLVAHLTANAKRAGAARALRTTKLSEAHERLITKLSDQTFRALYIAVARLFASELSKDMYALKEISKFPQGKSPAPLLKTISLAGKWAPTPGLSHDRVTNLSSAISLLLASSASGENLPKALNDQALGAWDRFLILRSYYQRWFLRPLREAIQCPEPHMSAKRWNQIRYSRVPSICMKNSTELFFTHDPKRFKEYFIKVEEGKKSISDAAPMPHNILLSILTNGSFANGNKDGTRNSKHQALQEVKKKAAAMRHRLAESQWKVLVENLRSSGSLNNTLAVCHDSGYMGEMNSKSTWNSPQSIQVAVALSLILASLAKPPFHGGFITVSPDPQYVKLDLDNKPVQDTVDDMIKAALGYYFNMDFNAVFLKLLLPLAKKHGLKQEDMVKRLFVFSDMPFDEALNQQYYDRMAPVGEWDANYNIIEKAYKEAGYEAPQIVYWNLRARRSRPGESIDR